MFVADDRQAFDSTNMPFVMMNASSNMVQNLTRAIPTLNGKAYPKTKVNRDSKHKNFNSRDNKSTNTIINSDLLGVTKTNLVDTAE